MWVPQEELLRGPAVSSTDSVPTSFSSQKLWENNFLALESWTGESGVGLGLLDPEISLPNFNPCGCGASLLSVCTPPTSLDGYGFFNSVVVRLLFIFIS